MYYSTRNRRRLTFETLMTMPSEPESKAFYTYTDGEDRVEVLNDTFTLVLSRDVRKNSRIAAEIAFQLAKERPQDDVLYVNTYAGVALMKEAFSKALEKSGMGQPPPDPRLEKAGEIHSSDLEEAGEIHSSDLEEAWKINDVDEIPPPFQGGGEGVVEVAPEKIRLTSDEAIDQVTARGLKYMLQGGRCSVYGESATDEDRAWAARIELVYPNSDFDYGDDDDEEEDEEEEDHDEEYGQEPSILGNLFIHDVPFGTWDTSRLERDITDRGRADCHTIVVLNSFEFASMGREQKSKMAKELLELRSKLGLSFLIFSHDLKRDLAAGLPCRGPLGIISANAGSVQRLNDPFENLIRHRKDELAREKNWLNALKKRLFMKHKCITRIM